MEKTYTKLQKALRFVGLTLHDAKEFMPLDDESEWSSGEVALVRSFVLDTIKEQGCNIWRRRICLMLHLRRATQVCRHLNISRSTLHRWLKGAVPDVRHQKLIEQYLLDWPAPEPMKRRARKLEDNLHPKILDGQRPWLLEDGTYIWCYAKDVPLDAVKRLEPHQLKGKRERT